MKREGRGHPTEVLVNAEPFVVSSPSDGCNDADMEVLEHQFCLPIHEPTTIAVRSLDSGEEHSASYTVNLQMKNVTLNNEEFTETITLCERNAAPINFFEAIVELGTSSTIGATNVAYLKFRIPLNANLVVGTEYTIDADNDGFTGVEIQDGDVETRPVVAQDYVSDSTHTCTVEFTDFEKSRKAAGMIACTLTQGPLSNNNSLGATVSIPSTEWVCDRWGYDA
jgi:hypothetical protein